LETIGRTGEGLRALRAALDRPAARAQARLLPPADAFETEVKALAERLTGRRHALEVDSARLAWALLCDESDRLTRRIAPAASAHVAGTRARIAAIDPEWRSAEAARGYEAVEAIVKAAVRKATSADPVRRRVDRIVTHRIFGPILFALVMGVIFQAIY